MALLFCDSFDHYPSADILQKWSSFPGNDSSIQPTGRHGSSCMRMSTQLNGQRVRKLFGASVQTVIVGFAWRHLDSIASTYNFFLIGDSGTSQLTLSITPGLVLRLARGSTELAVGTTVLEEDVYYYIEIEATIDNTVGAFEVRINEVTEFSDSGVDTQASANASANHIDLVSSTNDASEFDDLYVCDDSGSVNNSFLGDVRVQALFPNANGASSGLTGSDADSVDNYLLVNEAAADDDATFVEGDAAGEKDTYGFDALAPGSGTVYGLQILPFARKTDAGGRTMVTVARHGVTEEDSSPIALSTTYTYHPDVREEKPGGGAWTIADINAAEFGVKIAS